jgi:hypothetical protein
MYNRQVDEQEGIRFYMPDSLSPALLSYAHLVPKGSPALPKAPIDCQEHFLDGDLVRQGSSKQGIAPSRRLEAPAWLNTTRSVFASGEIKPDEELYILARAHEGGFIWVPRKGQPTLTTLIDLLVGHTGGSTLYRNATNSSSVTDTYTREGGLGKRKNGPPAPLYELWAVPRVAHAKRIITPGEAARPIHMLFARSS